MEGLIPGKKCAALLDFAEMLIVTMFVVTLVFTYVFRIFAIRGDSMCNTLMSGDRVVVSVLSREFNAGDIVLIRADTAVTLNDDGSLNSSGGMHDTIVKRIVAVGGQTVDIDFGTGAVYIDGERIFERYVRLGLTHKDEGAFTGQYPVTVPEGHFFVMGDNRSASKDSRSPELGFVPRDSVAGKVIFRLSPSPGTVE